MNPKPVEWRLFLSLSIFLHRAQSAAATTTIAIIIEIPIPRSAATLACTQAPPAAPIGAGGERDKGGNGSDGGSAGPSGGKSGSGEGGGEPDEATRTAIFIPLLQCPAVPQMKYRVPAAFSATVVFPLLSDDIGLLGVPHEP